MKTESRHIAFCICAGFLLFLTFSNAMPVYAQFQTIPVERLLNPDGTINTIAGVNGTLDLRGWNITLDSKRGPILSPQLEPLATTQAQPTDQWWALPNNPESQTVNALAVIGNDLYVYTGGGSIAKFHTVNGTWSVTGVVIGDNVVYDGRFCSSVSGDVYAFAVSGTDLYIGGAFGVADPQCSGASSAHDIIKFDTLSNTSSALPHIGLNGDVEVMAVTIPCRGCASVLYVGGKFTASADGLVTNLNHIAKFDTGSSAWSALPRTGLNDTVYAVAVSGSDLYAGGAFTGTADGALTRNHFAKLSGGVWVVLANGGLNDDVFALAVNGGDLYVGGLFTSSSDGTVTNLNRIAGYDTSNDAWSALANQGLSGAVLVLEVVTPCQGCLNVVYVGGGFSQTADGAVTNLNHIAKISSVLGEGMVWSAMPNRGLNGAANALAGLGDDLYVGGAFTQTQDGAVKDFNFIARLAPRWTEFLPLVAK